MILYREVILLIIFIGILLITIDLSKENNSHQKQKIIYKYIPRTLEEEEESPIYVSDIFNTMFSQPSPWVGGMENKYMKKDVVISQ